MHTAITVLRRNRQYLVARLMCQGISRLDTSILLIHESRQVFLRLLFRGYLHVDLVRKTLSLKLVNAV